MREMPLYRRVDLYEVREGVVDLRPRPRHARLYVCAAIAALAAALWLLWPAPAGAIESEEEAMLVKEAALHAGYAGYARFDLEEMLGAVADGRLALPDLDRIVIRIPDVDRRMPPVQILSQHAALYESWNHAIYLVQGIRQTVLEGTDFATATFGGWVTVIGVKIYPTATGTRQAVVITPAFKETKDAPQKD